MTSLVGQEAEHVCHWCASIFLAPLGQSWNMNFYCSPECRRWRRNESLRKGWHRRENEPTRVLLNRERNRAWAKASGLTKRASPWLRGAPPYADSLPCVELDISFGPRPKWPIELRNMRGVHGAISAILSEACGIKHREHVPTFAARIHDAQSIRVVVWDPRAAELEDAKINGVLWDKPTEFHVRDVVAVSSPERSLKRGRRKVRLTAITPVTMSKDGHSRPEVRPCKASIERSISGNMFAGRLGVSDPDVVRAEIVKIRTEPSHVQLGGKFGTVPGWLGDVEMEVNAPGLWLLRVAEKVGLGSRVAFGFGRIVVEELDA